jgi:tetratricopeptide (TPR) repeat protein
MRLVYAVFILSAVLMASAQCQQSAEDWFNKGTILGFQGKYDEAIEAYDEAIRLDPSYAEIWVNKGLAFRNQGKYDEAIKAYDEAIKLDPKPCRSLEQQRQCSQLPGRVR